LLSKANQFSKLGLGLLNGDSCCHSDMNYSIAYCISFYQEIPRLEAKEHFYR
jgi:hypothetical protein